MNYYQRLIRNIQDIYRKRGFKGLLRKIPHHADYIFRNILGFDRGNYQKWINNKEEDLIQEYLPESDLKYKPKISIVMALYNVDPIYLKKAVQSVLDQTYTNWELCIHNDASTKHLENIDYIKGLTKEEERVKFSDSKVNENISKAMNHCLEMATGEYFIILDNDDELSNYALEILVSKINQYPDSDYIYTDEDKLEYNGKRTEPLFKPDWSPSYTLSMMYTTHISLFRTEKVRELGGFREGYEAAQDYDLLLRYTEVIDESKIVHIPVILYHWRKVLGSTAIQYEEKGNAKNSARKALKDAVKRRDLQAEVLNGMTAPSFRIKYQILNDPKVSIIIPTYNGRDLLERCINSILDKTDYDNYEIIVVDNNSDQKESIDYLKEISEYEKIKVLKFNEEFNFSKINNFAASRSNGTQLLFLNNDTEVISEEWLSSMLELSQLPSVGAVGSMLLFPDDTYQHAGIVTGIGGVAGHPWKKLDRDNTGHMGQPHVIREVSAVTAACLMVSREKFDEVGGFNEDLRVSYNDVDLCLKLGDAGYRNHYTPYSVLYHHESVTRGSDDDPARLDEARKEAEYIKDKWGDKLYNDPYYNRNFTLTYEDYSLDV